MNIIKTLIFHMLLSLRGIILTISKLLSFALLSCLVMVECLSDFPAIPSLAKTMMVSFGILFTLIYWFYDYAIFYVKPRMIDIMLIR